VKTGFLQSGKNPVLPTGKNLILFLVRKQGNQNHCSGKKYEKYQYKVRAMTHQRLEGNVS